MQHVLDELAASYEYIFLDTPPVLPVTDALVLAPKIDALMLVVRLGHTTRERVKHAVSAMARVNADIVGVIPNQAGKGADSDYRYQYRYVYAATHNRDGSPAVDIAAEALHHAGEKAPRRATDHRSKGVADPKNGSAKPGSHRPPDDQPAHTNGAVHDVPVTVLKRLPADQYAADQSQRVTEPNPEDPQVDPEMPEEELLTPPQLR